MSDTPERSETATVTITVGKGYSQSTEFPVYPGTEMVYFQTFTAAVAAAGVELSKAAYNIITDGEGDAPGVLGVEAKFGKAVQDAG